MPGEAFWVWLKEQVIALQKKKSTPWTNRRRQELLNSGKTRSGLNCLPFPRTPHPGSDHATRMFFFDTDRGHF
jgi:hypothetical protein